VVRVQVIATAADFATACSAIASGTGPLAIDAERASGFTYSQRAFLIQVYRREAGTFLFDPPAIGDMRALFDQNEDEEWVLHAASQDLACLREVGITPRRIFDTELSARLLGMERVGLGAVVEELLGIHLAKEHSAVDWSTRPLPDPWLTYAALDVELLVDLRDAMHALLGAAQKLEWAYEEFQATLDKPDKPAAAEPWRRISGLHTLRTPRQLCVARALWEARDDVARNRDSAPGRLIPDASIVAAARSPLTNKSELASMKEFHGRASRSLIDTWWNAIVVGLNDQNPPVMRVPSDQLPPPRAWADRRPEALERLQTARDALLEVAESVSMPVENLLTPSVLRELAWAPPAEITSTSIRTALADKGARNWQISLVAEHISQAFVEADQKSAEEAENSSLDATATS
jgi:ribonuclease D